jgi:hypothetical protein
MKRFKKRFTNRNMDPRAIKPPISTLGMHGRLCGVKRPYVIETSEGSSLDSSCSTINCAPVFNIYLPWTTASVHYMLQ